MTAPPVQDGSTASQFRGDMSNVDLTIAQTTGGIATDFDTTADFDELHGKLNDMNPGNGPLDSSPSDNFHFASQFEPTISPSFPGPGYALPYLSPVGDQSYSIDPSQPFHHLVGANRSSVDQPWTSLEATGVPVALKAQGARQTRTKSGPRTATQLDVASISFKDSGIGTDRASIPYDASSQTGSPQVDMNQRQWAFDEGQHNFTAPTSYLPIPPQPQEVSTEAGDDDRASVTGAASTGHPTGATSFVRPGPRKAPKKEPHLRCTRQDCNKMFSTASDLKKHEARHDRVYQCDVEGCKKSSVGFATVNDLIRHNSSVHSQRGPGTKLFKCFAPGCPKADKIWPRLDNFKQHLIRIHPNEYHEDLLQRCKEWFERENPQDPADSMAVRDVIHEQEENATIGNKRKRSRKSKSDQMPSKIQKTEAQLSPSEMSMSHDAAYVTPQTLHQTNFQGSRLVSEHEAANQQLRQHHQEPHASPAFLSNTPVTSTPYQHAMSRSVSDLPTQSGRRRPASVSDAGERGLNPMNQAAAWSHYPQLENLKQPHDMQTMLAQQATIDPRLFAVTISSFKANTVANPQDMASQQLFVADTKPVAPPQDNMFSDFNESMMGVGAANEPLDGSSADAYPPCTPTIKINDQMNHSQLDHRDVTQALAEELTRFISEHEARRKPGESPLTVEDIRQNIRTILSEGSRSQCSPLTPSIADRSQDQEVSIDVSVKGKSHIKCQTCGKLYFSQSVMNKHLKRHSRPYGCVLDDCYKSFGSKNDWKRHETTHPQQKECFRCDGGHLDPATMNPCYDVYYNGEGKYRQHLQQCGVSRRIFDDIIARRQIRGNNQLGFWCGFCNKVIRNSLESVEALNERLKHIDFHFQHEKKKVSTWIELGGNGKTKSEVQKEQNEVRQQQMYAGRSTRVAVARRADSESTSRDSASSIPSSSDAQFYVPSAPQSTLRTVRHASQAMQRHLSSSALQNTPPMSQYMWNHPPFMQAPQSVQRPQPPAPPQSRPRPRPSRPHADDAMMPRNQHGRRIVTTIHCCVCTGSWPFQLSRRCPECDHDSCRNCTKS